MTESLSFLRINLKSFSTTFYLFIVDQLRTYHFFTIVKAFWYLANNLKVNNSCNNSNYKEKNSTPVSNLSHTNYFPIGVIENLSIKLYSTGGWIQISPFLPRYRLFNKHREWINSVHSKVVSISLIVCSKCHHQKQQQQNRVVV